MWVTHPGLPDRYWSGDALSKISSAIRNPMCIDNFTASIDRISYARILVETDVSHPLLYSIEIVTSSGTFQQAIEYDWQPKCCTECMKFGHNMAECWTKKKGKEMEEPMPQFQMVKKKQRRNRKARQPRFD